MALMIPRAMIDEFKDELLSLASDRMDAMADKMAVELANETDPAVIEAKLNAAIAPILAEVQQLRDEFQRRCQAVATDPEEPTLN
jgi:hypothetical protein